MLAVLPLPISLRSFSPILVATFMPPLVLPSSLRENFFLVCVPRVAWTDAVVGQGLVFDDDLESTPRLCVDRDQISLLRMSVLPGSKVELYMMRVHPQSGDLQAMGDEEMATFINMKLCGL